MNITRYQMQDDCIVPDQQGRYMLVREVLPEIERLNARIVKLEAALKEVAIGRGEYSLDPYTHACNCLDHVKQVAKEALEQ